MLNDLLIYCPNPKDDKLPAVNGQRWWDSGGLDGRCTAISYLTV